MPAVDVMVLLGDGRRRRSVGLSARGIVHRPWRFGARPTVREVSYREIRVGLDGYHSVISAIVYSDEGRWNPAWPCVMRP